MATERTNRPVHGGNLTWAAEVAGCPPNLLLDFSASISPLGPPKSVLEAIEAGISDLKHYPSPEYGNLRQTLGAVHGLSPDWILPGNGSAELLTWACRDFSDCLITCLPTPAFGDYFRGLKAFNAAVLECPLELDEDRRSASRLKDILAAPLALQGTTSAAAGLLFNNPHNPSGYLFSGQELGSLLDRFDLVVVDEAFMDFLPLHQQESLIDQVASHPNLVILRSLTKFYSLPGLRLGYAIGHPDRLRRWQQWRDPWPVNVLAAAAAQAAVQDHAFQQQSWEWLAIARPHLYSGLQAIAGLHPLPGAANYLLVRSDYPVLPLQTALLKRHRILIRDCLSFAELGNRYFRVAVRTLEENQRLLYGLTEVLSQFSSP
ncbi:MAG: threonine-phosphate decarboxylase [Cyanobacteria bacterium Co-bin8]|nr:threonine-phosphate decarboxylase [Cyanobacteria bacterium Co-bin8]